MTNSRTEIPTRTQSPEEQTGVKAGDLAQSGSASPRGKLAMSADILGWPNWGEGCYWQRMGRSQRWLYTSDSVNTGPHSKASDPHRVEAEILWLEGSRDDVPLQSRACALRSRLGLAP